MNRVNRTALALVALCLSLSSLAAQARPEDRPSVAAIDDYLSALVAAHRIPGLSVAVVRGDEVLLAKGYGDDGLGGPMGPGTRLCIGSVSKSLTALAVVQLSRRGLLDLDASFSDYVPWFATAGAGSEGITVRHLLTHTSGLDETGDPRPEIPGASLEEEVRSLALVRPSAAPGTRYAYYNKNYRALGHLVEALSGQPYGEYLREHIFEPLGMAGASLDPAGMAEGTAPFFGLAVPVPNTYYDGDAPAGGVIMGAADAARYLSALLASASGQPPAAIGAGFLGELASVPAGVDSRYGLGWRVERDGARLVHAGDVSGFHAYAEVNLDTGLGCAILCRQNGLGLMLGAYDQLPLDVHALLAGEPASDPRSGAWLPFATLMIGALVAAYHAWRFAALPSWFRRAAGRPAAFRIASALLPVAPASCFLCLPALVAAATGLACEWSDLFHFSPDVAAIALAGAGATIARAAARLAGLASRAFRAR